MCVIQKGPKLKASFFTLHSEAGSAGESSSAEVRKTLVELLCSTLSLRCQPEEFTRVFQRKRWAYMILSSLQVLFKNPMETLASAELSKSTYEFVRRSEERGQQPTDKEFSERSVLTCRWELRNTNAHSRLSDFEEPCSLPDEVYVPGQYFYSLESDGIFGTSTKFFDFLLSLCAFVNC